jgi:hypothetical protein
MVEKSAHGAEVGYCRRKQHHSLVIDALLASRNDARRSSFSRPMMLSASTRMA